MESPTTAELLARCRSLVEKGRLPNGESPAVLATADESGNPSARYVLVKEVDDRGFVFYTNANSRKGREIHARPQAALVFHWPESGMQLRVAGGVEEVEAAAADAYWKSRPRESQIAALASAQSESLESREELLARVARLGEAHEGKAIPRPAYWTGFRVVPREVEFWTRGEHRLHHREQYRRLVKIDTWKRRLLQP